MSKTQSLIPRNLPQHWYPTAAQITELHSMLTQAQAGDGLVDLTKLCKAFGQHPGNFLRLRMTKNLIESWAEGKSVSPSCITTKDEDGTVWGHHSLAIRCAGWLSPDFEVYHIGARLEMYKTCGELQILAATLDVMESTMATESAREEEARREDLVAHRSTAQRRVVCIF